MCSEKSRSINQEAKNKIIQLLKEHKKCEKHLDKATIKLKNFVFGFMQSNGMWNSLEGVSEVMRFLPMCFLRFQLSGRYEELKNAQTKSQVPKVDRQSTGKIDEETSGEIHRLFHTCQKYKMEVKNAEESLKHFICDFMQSNDLWNNRAAVAEVIRMLPESNLRSELFDRYHEINDLAQEQTQEPAAHMEMGGQNM